MRRRRPTKRKVVGDLELIAKATEPAFWPNPIEQLPRNGDSDDERPMRMRTPVGFA